MDTSPVTARQLGTYFLIEGDKLNKIYKDHLSGYRSWEQINHAWDWILQEQNIGERLSIDETMLSDDLFTIVSNKEGHGRQGTIVAIVRGTKSADVVSVLNRIPEEKRLQVKEITMDYASNMKRIANLAFPNAQTVTDCFHTIKMATEAIESVRLKLKQEAMVIYRKEEREWRAKCEKCRKANRHYRKRHPKTYTGSKRGRKPLYIGKYKPKTFDNGDTVRDLLTRSKHILTKSADKWSKRQKERARILFETYPQLKELYGLLCQLRAVFSDKKCTREEGRKKLQRWYKAVAACTNREMKAVREQIKQREEDVLNYFNARSTNASAESLNAKLKAFRSQLRGVADFEYFMYRICKVMG